MSRPLITAADCCTTCSASATTTVCIKGDPGAAGAAGAAGADGLNAFTTTTANFTVPAFAGTVKIAVVDNSWAITGMYVYIGTAGTFLITAADPDGDGLHITIQNPEDAAGHYADNVAPTTVIATPQSVTPTGQQGIDAATAPYGAAYTGDGDPAADPTDETHAWLWYDRVGRRLWIWNTTTLAWDLLVG